MDTVFDNSDQVLDARDNTGLGYARAVQVARELRKIKALSKYTILPYSAGQLILPNESISRKSLEPIDPKRRRIEIIVRRKSELSK